MFRDEADWKQLRAEMIELWGEFEKPLLFYTTQDLLKLKEEVVSQGGITNYQEFKDYLAEFSEILDNLVEAARHAGFALKFANRLDQRAGRRPANMMGWLSPGQKSKAISRRYHTVEKSDREEWETYQIQAKRPADVVDEAIQRRWRGYSNSSQLTGYSRDADEPTPSRTWTRKRGARRSKHLPESTQKHPAQV
ncbi:hypothetical protein PCANC_21288 [Puccinia coronata f. sp. avenae]|uniref:Uncharacterized protein n=1 Tax=Puccinia coronata f. sp. avenae TaxID=200324 RepID=A0A2N5SBW2_9BASI|nr:hypothetical protein PCANC_21288 [Puccinia coronata f. sp. avenae]